MTHRHILIPIALILIAAPVRADHDAIDEAFVKLAPRILDRLQARGAQNVGVLKFLVQRGDSQPDDAVGELNMGLADRLEAALILADNNEKLGIIERASLAVVANNNRLANHRTEEGRQAFFGDTYRLAWGDKKVKPSAFVTGLAQISRDLKSVTMKLQLFGEDGSVESIGEPIIVPATRRTLVEAGYSYVLTERTAPSLFDGARGSRTNKGAVVKIKAEDEAAALSQTVSLHDSSKTEGVRFTAADALRDSPVRLTVLYNGKPAPVEKDHVREPLESDRVTFLLENTDNKSSYAVVLKVNGKNTLFSEDLEAGQCLKWVLAPGAKLVVAGFQEDDRKATPFKILSARESEENTFRYGDLTGTVRLVAFRGETVTEDPSAVEKKDLEPQHVTLAAVARGSKGLKKGEDRPGSLAALKADLLGREKQTEGMRGVIDKSSRKEDRPIQRVYFQSLPTVAVADITIRYYSTRK
jgi:hypothetical protein